jgi:transcriptional antiterminator
MSFKQKYSQAIVNKVHELSPTNSVKLISEAMNLSERTVRYILKQREPQQPQDVMVESYNETAKPTKDGRVWKQIKRFFGIS